MPLAKGDAVSVLADGRVGTVVKVGKRNALVQFEGEEEPRAFRPDEISAAPDAASHAVGMSNAAELLVAAAAGDEAKVAALLAGGAPADLDGQIAVQLALTAGHAGTVAALLGAGALISAPPATAAAEATGGAAAAASAPAPTSLRLTRSMERAAASEPTTPVDDPSDPHALVNKFRADLASWLADAEREKCAELAAIAVALEGAIAQGQGKKKQQQVAKMREQLGVVHTKNHEQLASIEVAAYEQLQGLRQKAVQLAEMLANAEQSYTSGLAKLQKSSKAPQAKIDAARAQAEAKLGDIRIQARGLFSEQVTAATNGYSENVTQYKRVAHHRLLKFNAVADQQLAVLGVMMELPVEQWGLRAGQPQQQQQQQQQQQPQPDLPSYMQPKGMGKRKGPPVKPKRKPPKPDPNRRGSFSKSSSSFGSSSRFVAPKPVTGKHKQSHLNVISRDRPEIRNCLWHQTGCQRAW